MVGQPTPRTRTIVAIVIGLAAAIMAYVHLRYFEDALGFDFTWPWRAARILIAGGNPYQEIRPDGPFPFDAYFKYPLPAALIAVPLAWLTAPAAAAVFGGISTGLLAFGLTERNWGRLYILLSPPFVVTVGSGQWSTILMAGALLPALSWIAICKPTVALAVFAYRPNWWTVMGGAFLLLVSFAVLPSWLNDWIGVLRVDNLAHWYMAPIALTGGPLILLALLRWRRPEARYLVGISIVPHILGFYAGFFPMLVAETRREAQMLSLGSAVAWFATGWAMGSGSFISKAPVLAGYPLLVFIFLPALIVVLRRPNEGALGPRLERMAARLPSWLRGEIVGA